MISLPTPSTHAEMIDVMSSLVVGPQVELTGTIDAPREDLLALKAKEAEAHLKEVEAHANEAIAHALGMA